MPTAVGWDGSPVMRDAIYGTARCHLCTIRQHSLAHLGRDGIMEWGEGKIPRGKLGGGGAMLAGYPKFCRLLERKNEGTWEKGTLGRLESVCTLVSQPVAGPLR